MLWESTPIPTFAMEDNGILKKCWTIQISSDATVTSCRVWRHCCRWSGYHFRGHRHLLCFHANTSDLSKPPNSPMLNWRVTDMYIDVQCTMYVYIRLHKHMHMIAYAYDCICMLMYDNICLNIIVYLLYIVYMCTPLCLCRSELWRSLRLPARASSWALCCCDCRRPFPNEFLGASNGARGGMLKPEDLLDSVRSVRLMVKLLHSTL